MWTNISEPLLTDPHYFSKQTMRAEKEKLLSQPRMETDSSQSLPQFVKLELKEAELQGTCRHSQPPSTTIRNNVTVKNKAL